MDDTTLDLQRRREIYECMTANSGSHLRDISRKMNIPVTSLAYHLNYLEKRGLIISKKDGKYVRYYRSYDTSDDEKKIISCFRKKTTLIIVLWFLIAIQLSQKDLSRFLEKHPATIGFQLRNMLHAGIIEQVSNTEGVITKDTLPSTIKRPQVSSEKIYVLTDPWRMYDLLLKHRDTLNEKELVSGIIDYVEYHISDGIPKQIQNREDTLNSVVNVFNYFFFPPSFCS